MAGAIWKLSSLATVVTVGGMIVFQARNGLPTAIDPNAPAQTVNGDPVIDPFASNGTDSTTGSATTGSPTTARSGDSFLTSDGEDEFASRTTARTSPRGVDLRESNTQPGFEDDATFAGGQSEPGTRSDGLSGDPFGTQETVRRTGGEIGNEPTTSQGTRTSGRAAAAFLEQEPGTTTTGYSENDNFGGSGTGNVAGNVGITETPFNDGSALETTPRTGTRTGARPRNALTDDSEFGGAQPRSRTALPANDPFTAGQDGLSPTEYPTTEEYPVENNPPASTGGNNPARPNSLTEEDDPLGLGRSRNAGPVEQYPAEDSYPVENNPTSPRNDGFGEQPLDSFGGEPSFENTTPRGPALPSGRRPSSALMDDDEPARERVPSGPQVLPEDMAFPMREAPVSTSEFESSTTGPVNTTDVLNLPSVPRRQNPAPMLRNNGARAKVTIEKVAPQQAFLGQPLIYHITLRNVGNAAAQQVVVEDPLPNSVEIVGTIPQAEINGRRLVWKIGTLPPGAEKKLAIKVIPQAEGPVGSAATVNYVADPAFNTSVTPDGRVTLDLQGPSQVNVGDNFSVTFKVTNNTDQKTDNVSIRDLLPAGLKHEGGSDLEYPVGELAPGQSKEVTLELTAAETGPAVSRAVVLASNEVLQNSEFRVDVLSSGADSTTSLRASTREDLSLTRQGPKTVLLQRPMTYANRISNRSSLRLVNLAVVEELPDGVDYVQAFEGGVYDPIKRRIIWQIEQLDPNSTLDLRVELTVTDKSAKTSQISVTDTAGNQVRTSQTVTATGAAHLNLEVNPVSGAVSVGDLATYEVVVKNRGSDTARLINLQLELPPGLQLHEAGPWSARTVGQVVEFDTLEELPPGQSTKAVLKFRAQRAGESHLRFQFSAEHMSKPLSREEAVLVIGE